MIGPELIKCLLLLLSLSILQSYVLRVSGRETGLGKILSGLVFGFAAIAGMVLPLTPLPGVTFDGNALFLSFAAFRGGPVVAGVAVILAAGFRSLQEIPALPMALTIMATAIGIGLIVRHLVERFHIPPSPLSWLIFGGVVHVATALCMLLIQDTAPSDAIYRSIIAQLIACPLATLVLGLLLFSMDRQLQKEQQLRERETRFRDLANSSGDFFFEQNADGMITEVSERFEEITGISREKVAGRLFRRIIDWQSVGPEAKRALLAQSEQRPFKDVEIPLRFEGSRLLWLRASALPLFSEKGTFLGFRGAATNITRQVWERNTLAERERRLNALYDNMQEGLVVYQLVRNRMGKLIDYRLIDANPAFERQTGLVRESVIGRLASLVYGTGSAPHLETYSRVAESEQPAQFEAFFETLGRHLTISAFSLGEDLVVSVFRDVTDAVRGMEQLRASEARFRDYADCAADWFFELNAEGAITYLSDRFEQIVGAPKGFFLGKNYIDLFEDTEVLAKPIETIRQQRPLRNTEARLKLPNGNRVWIRASANPLFDNSGDFAGYRGTATEVTAEKEFHAAIMRERDRARLYLEMAGTIMVVMDRDGAIKEINRKGQELLGRTRESLIGRKWVDIAIPEEEAEKIRAIHSALMNGELDASDHIVSKLVTSTGEERIIAWTNSFIEDSEGSIFASISSGEDITERREAETALAESQRQLATLMSNLPGMAYRCRIDRDWSMEFVSTGVEKLTGYRASDIVEGGNITYGQLIHPDDRDRVWNEVGKTKKTGKPFSFIYRITTAAGELRWVWEQGRTIFAPDGSPQALEGFASDITDRIESEQALRESEERFRSMFENSSDAIVVRNDAAGRFEDANPAAVDLYGYSRDEFLRLSPLDLTAEIEPTQMAIELLEKEGRLHLDIRWHKKKDGTVVPVEVSVWTFPLGGSRKFVAAMRDISRRVAAESALRESEARFRAILEASPSAIFLKDRGGRYVLANPAFCARVGLPLAEIIGKSIRDVRPPSAIATSEEHDREVMESGTQKTLEMTVQERDSQWHTYLSAKYPIVDANGNISGLACVSTDISGRIQAEAALAESEIKFRTIVETISEGVLEFDPDGTVTFTSNRLLEMLGYDQDEMLGQSYLNFVDEDWRGPHRKRRAKQKVTGRGNRQEVLFHRKDGSEMWAAVSTTPKRDESGCIVSYVTLITDMAHQHQLDTRIRNLEDHLTHASRISQAGELATSFAHQLNQPLAAARFYAQGLLDKFSRGETDQSEVQRVVGTIDEQMRRASEAISHIRAFLRRRKTTRENVALNDVVRAVIDLIRTDLKRFDTNLQTRLANPSPIVSGDPILLQQVVINLTQNAVEALADADSSARRIVITTSINRHGEAVLRVRDTGPGMAEETRERLFETFFTTKPEGLGMGLSICHTVVESHDGKIHARNHRSGGAVFEVIIPSVRG